MIIRYEIEKFCQDIESKLPQLEGKAKENALDKIAILNRVNIEFMDYEKLLRKSALDYNSIKHGYLKQQIEIKDLKSKIVYLQEIVNKLTGEYIEKL